MSNGGSPCRASATHGRSPTSSQTTLLVRFPAAASDLGSAPDECPYSSVARPLSPLLPALLDLSCMVPVLQVDKGRRRGHPHQRLGGDVDVPPVVAVLHSASTLGSALLSSVLAPLLLPPPWAPCLQRNLLLMVLCWAGCFAGGSGGPF